MSTKKELPAKTTITRNLKELDEATGNIYRSVAVMSKRADQIAQVVKEELHSKLEEFATVTDSLEEVYENREQIEISKHYERMPKPTAMAIYELRHDEVFFREPDVPAKPKELDA